MCTALNLTTNDHYFGRTLDLDCSYGEEVCVIPRNFPMMFRKLPEITSHYAMIGMATVVSDTPLFYDAVNEHGLAMAGLNFPGNAYYPPQAENRDNVTPFEFIPWILSQCKTVTEAQVFLEKINLVNIPFSPQLPLSPLHWIISDKTQSVVVESMKDGLHIYNNPTQVMTNNPPLPLQLFNLNNYRNLRVDNGSNTFSEHLPLETYCQGLGALGLPGDVSSMSRFVRVAFGRENSVCDGSENASVSQFFHILASVSMNRGLCKTDTGHWDITVYTACANTTKGRYYYTTYDNSHIHCVDMHRTDLSSTVCHRFPLILQEEIHVQN